MSRSCVLVFAVLPLAAAAWGQAMIEYSLGTARAAGTAAGMRRAGKSAAAILEKSSKITAGAKSAPATSSTTVVSAPASRAEAKLAPLNTADPAAIRAGMTREDLVRKFGEPAMKISSSEGASTVETWMYGAAPHEVTLKLRDGCVVSSAAPPRPEAASGRPAQVAAGSKTGVVILQ